MSPRYPLQLSDRKRLLWLALGLFFLFSLLVAQFYRIQILEGAKWVKEARRQHFFVVKEPFIRGTFFSNTDVKKGHPALLQSFVVDIQKFHFYVDPLSIPASHRRPVIGRLMQMIDLSVSEQIAFAGQFERKSRSRKLAMWLDIEARDAVLQWWLPYASRHKLPRNALFFVSDYQRSYPFGKLLGQVLHTIQNQKDEITQEAIPTGGLELQFNRYLKGKQGKRRLMRSPRNAFETGEVIASPEDGANIYLTINHCLQAIAEEEIAKGVKKSNAKAGWAVMMNPYTGEILALAQYPFFYPYDYQAYFNKPDLIENTRVKALTDANEPGSVMKPLTMAAALQANEVLRVRGEKPIFSPQDKIVTSNSHFKGRSKPLKDVHFHRFLNMDMALQKSSNTYVARLVESIIDRLGKQWYREFLQDTLGFGVKTGVELPAESGGVLPTPGKLHPNGTLEWSAPTPYSLAMGHNIQATALQLVRAYAIFANGGYLVEPTIIRKIVKKNQKGEEEVLRDNTGQKRSQQFPRVLHAEIVQRTVQAMKYATKAGGTASRANVWGYTEAGKTGTANKIVNGVYSPTQYCSTFVGFTPVVHPAFVLLVTLDEPEYGYVPGVGKKHHGGACCAPVFREIATRSLEYLGTPSDDPHGYPSGDPRYDPEKADWLPEIRRLQEIYQAWNN
jgi:cell division protein FtsI (penicillin-binding protein 3)